MKPITNILLVLALVFYVFLPIMDILHMGSITGMDFSSSLITKTHGLKQIIYALTPYITIFLAIGFNCLRSRWWGIIDAILILMAIFFFVNILTKFQGLPLDHDPEVMADTEMSEGLPINGFRSGFYLSAGTTILAFISALVSLMPFSFNKRLEERIDKRFESGKKHIEKVGHSIHDEIHKIGKKTKEKEPELNETPQEKEGIEANESNEGNEGNEVNPTPSLQPEDESRFMPDSMSEDEKYKDYMPK